MKRPLVALLALAAYLTGSGQSCFQVVEAGTRRPVPFCEIECVGLGHGLSMGGVADSTGRVCLAWPCARIEIRSQHHRTVRVDMAEVMIAGLVLMHPDVIELEPAVIEPWPGKEDRHALAANTTIDSALLAKFERASMRSAALWIPGVQWDERGHGGSQRLSIRGSLLRSPYGVRGVKVYWGPFPLTLADGSTPLELLDPVAVGSVDVVRSVGSPVYGSAPSGMLLTTAPLRADSGMDATIEAIGGAYGYYRLGTLTRSHNNSSDVSAGMVHQRNDGYRAQEWSARDQAFIVSRFRRERSTSQVFITWQNASWALPGSLDSLTAANDPRSARPYSALINAHIEKQQLLAGVGSELLLGQHVRLRSAVHAQLIDKKNPYGTSAALCGYKDETIRAAGARLSLGGQHRSLNKPIAWEFGSEALFERDRWRENTYVDREIGGSKVDADTRVSNLNAFASTITRIGPNTTLHAAVGMERTGYDHQDHLGATDNALLPDAAVYPLLGLEHVTSYGWKLHLRYAEAVSRPTVWELLGTAGEFNRALAPESVSEVELGVSNGDGPSLMSTAFQIYYRRTQGLIMEQTASDDVNREFINIGQAEMGGIEWWTTAHLDAGTNWRSVVLMTATLQFPELDIPGRSAVETPGIEPFRGALLIQVQHRDRTSIEAGIRYASDVGPGIGSSIRIPQCAVAHARLGHRLRWKGADLVLFLHCENLLDARYSSWLQINDPGGRYYNPAPGRSFFGGARLTFGSSKPRSTD